jgi:4-hydroxy 2-oxovalerate aldolase
MTVKLLDCTLRDGGYVNSWKFGKNIIEKIVKNLVESRVEIIELGYLQGDVFDNDTSLFQNILQIENLLKDALSFEAKNVSFYCMVNFGHFDVSSLPNLDSKPNTLHGIRLAFHKSDLDNIDESIKEIKQKGYYSTKDYQG